MGFLNDLIGTGGGFGGGINDPFDLGGQGASAAAIEAARIQAGSATEAIEAQERARQQAREDLSPFRKAGEQSLTGLLGLANERAGAGTLEGAGRLITDPNAQRQFITQNPFFNALADDAQSRLFANQAARGKVGSGGTAKALQNSLLLLGTDLLNQNINQRFNLSGRESALQNQQFGQRFNLATLGSNAAAGQATATLSTSNTISDLLTQSGNAQAAGLVGAANARTQAGQGLLQAGGTALGGYFASLSDERFKTDIQEVGELHNGLPVYTYKYKGDDTVHMGVMAQELEKVIPKAVHTIDGIKYVDYGEITCR